MSVWAFDVASIKYLGCRVRIEADSVSVDPTAKDYAANCVAFASLINDAKLNRKVAAVFLVSHRPFEYEDNVFRFDLVRWLRARSPELEFFVFGNYFQLERSAYPWCDKLMARAKRDASVCLELAAYPGAAAPPFELLPAYPKDLPLRYIDLIALHCGYDKRNCAYQAAGVPFISDWNHLNASFVDWILTDIRARRKPELSAAGLLKYFKAPSM